MAAHASRRATRISTTGGFFRRGNATLLIGVETTQVDDVLARIENACAATRSVPASPNRSEACATVFVLHVERFDKVWRRGACLFGCVSREHRQL